MAVIPWLGHLIELAAVAMFALAWQQARRAGGGEHVELVIAAVYGWLLEALDMLIFGTYHYGAVSWWWCCRSVGIGSVWYVSRCGSLE